MPGTKIRTLGLSHLPVCPVTDPKAGGRLSQREDLWPLVRLGLWGVLGPPSASQTLTPS